MKYKWTILIVLFLLKVDLVVCNEADENDKCVEEERIDSDVEVASLQLEEVKIPLIFSTFILVVILFKTGWHHPMMQGLSSHIPESIVLITVGTFLGGFLVAAFRLDECNRDGGFPIRFTPQLFFLVLLPPIIFASVYFMNTRSFFENFITIIIYAVIGTVWNAFALGFTLFGLSAANLMTSNLSIASALLFGTINAAVDPVAVLAVFDEIHVNKLLHILVFGESLLNDAVTIVLFQVLGAFANIEFDENRDENIPRDIGIGITQFFVVIIASVVIGIIGGCAAVLFSRITPHVHVLEPVMLLVMGYLAYVLADLFAFSGIVSLIACVIIMKHYVAANIAWKSNITFKYTLKMLNIISEMIIFLFLGISLFDSAVHSWDTGLVLWTVFFAALYRPIGVIILTLVINPFRFNKIDAKQVFIMSYSGLRGAVAFSLALTRLFEPGFETLPEEEMTLRKSMLTATTVLLMFTVFVQGTTIKPLVKRIRVQLRSLKKPTMNEVIHGTAMDHINSGMEDIAGHFGFNRLREWFSFLDVRYLRKLFERNSEAIDEEIIRKFRKLQFKESHDQYFEFNSESESSSSTLPRSPLDTSPSSASIQTNDDTCVPALHEVLKTSYVHPHEDHFPHMLARDEMELRDHHLQRVNVAHRVKRRTRKYGRTLQRRRTTLGIGYTPQELEQLDMEIQTVSITQEKSASTDPIDATDV